jgi:hypothetical protein
MKLTRENRSTWGKTCPNAILSTTNPTWTDPGSNPVLRGDRSATNRLSHGTAFWRNLLPPSAVQMTEPSGRNGVIYDTCFMLMPSLGIYLNCLRMILLHLI